MPQISLTNFVPVYCPVCGRKLSNNPQALAGGCTDRCTCGALYQQVTTSDLIYAATEAGGDLEGILLVGRLIAVTGVLA